MMDAARITPWHLITILILTIAISGCSTQPVASMVPTEPPQESSPTTQDVEPTPTSIPSPEPYASNLSCVGCHTDQEMLIATASQVEEEKPESSGEG